jgi:hypothetical protein
MYIFGTDGTQTRGCFHEMSLNGKGSLGAYLVLAGLKQSPQAPFFVTHVGFAEKERFNVVQCFNDRNYVYAFGHDPQSSMVSVHYTAFLARPDAGVSGSKPTVTTFLETYDKARLSKSLTRADLHIANTLLHGFVVGMESSTQNPETNTQSFQIVLLLTEAQTGI